MGAPAFARKPGAGPSGLGSGQRPEDQSLAIGRHIDLDFVPPTELSHENLLAERILDVPLNRALQRPSSVVLVVTMFHQERGCGGGELDLVAQPALYLTQQN